LSKQIYLVKTVRQLLYLVIFFFPLFWRGAEAVAQRGKDGFPAIATNTVVNEYTTLTANAVSGATTITVASTAALNANGRFPAALAPGDLIMIIQIQGDSILGFPPTLWDPFSEPRDSTWGKITNYNNCGNWEFAEVTSVPNGTSISLDCPIKNNYSSIGKVVVVRVPRYSSLAINNGGSITCDPWNGTIGGICAIEVQNNTIINAGGSIDVTGKGFRGGALHNPNSGFGVGEAVSLHDSLGAEKGESIAGYQVDYDAFGGRYCQGAPANGGGGGNAHNCGGGGGANGGNPLLWNGHGIPDNSGPNWNLAWNLQYAGFSAQTSTGGGQGGYGFSNSNQNAIVVGPNNALWSGGDKRPSRGGFGGRPLDYSTGRLFLGGGGGAGEENNNIGGKGGNGGALIYIMNYGVISGAGQINSNGNIGASTTGIGTDGAGGAGAGGTIIVNSVGAISGVSITANGGKGGDQVKSNFASNEAEGPGGGGGGGYIAISNGTPTRTANGGANGTTNSFALTEFTPNGATQGAAGTNNGTVTNFIINTPNVTICAGQATTLNATLSGTVPVGTNINWYNSIVAGSIVGTGNTFPTGVLATGTYTYYVGTCPGTYHQPVIVTATSSPVISAGPDATICSAGNTTLNASGGTGYTWSPATGLSNANISNPVANPVSTTTYVVTVASPCGPLNDTVIVNVNSSIPASISGNTTICNGATTTLTATGGGNYSWNTGATTAAITVTPTTNTTYSVIVGSGSCTTTATATVAVTNGVNATINGPTAVCTGNSATLTASGGTNYSWNTGATTANIVVTPTSSSTYSVIVSSGTCSGTASITVNPGSNITASVSGNTTICSGSTATLTASGGSNYSWSTGSSNAVVSVTPVTTAATTYSVIVSSGSCSDTAYVNVNSVPATSVYVSGNNIICLGDASTLTATGGNSYLWSTGSTATTIVVAPAATSTYTIIAFGAFCNDTGPVTVTVVPQATATVSPSTTICSGQSAILTASGGTSYSWNTGAIATSISVSPSSNSTYSVVVAIGACSDTATTSVAVLPTPTVTVTNNTTICGGDVITLNASGGSGYLWSNGAVSSSITVNPATNTTYSVIASSGTCSDTGKITVTVSAAPTAAILGNSNICAGFATTLTATGFGTYAWSTGETTNVIHPTTSGTYSLIVSIGTCTATAVTILNVVPNPNAAVSPDIIIVQGQSTDLSASGGTNYIWSNGMNGGTISVSPTATTKYCVTVYDANNCQDTACVNVIVEICSNAGTLFLPNAFSPNGDGSNDSLQIYYGIPQCIKDFRLVIYNRWGEKIYETTDPAFKWDGIYNKGLLQGTSEAGTEVFTYYMDVAIMDGNHISRKGNISLVR